MAKVKLADLGSDFDTTVPGLEEANAHRFKARISEVAANPINPRRDPGDLSELAESLRSTGQLQPCTVVTRAAWLTHYPEHEDQLGTATYVIVAGSRRRAAAELAQLDVLDIIVKNDLAASREQLATAAIAENIERQDLGPLEEAEAVRRLVELCRSQRKAAKRLARTQAWVSQRLALLNLEPELAAALSKGELRIEDARRLAKLPADEQVDAWRAETEDRRDNAVIAPEHPDETASAAPAGDNGVIADEGKSGNDGATRPQPYRATRQVERLTRTVTQMVARTGGLDDVAHALRHALDPETQTKLAAALNSDPSHVEDQP